MKFVLALFAALGLLLGPVVAFATTAECGMSVTDMASMSNAGDAGSHERQPCCPDEKACVAACTLAALSVCEAPIPSSAAAPLAKSERLAIAAVVPWASLTLSTDKPPPRTLA